MTPELLTEIRNRAELCRSIAHGPNALLRALASADDVPVLLAEVERLRSALQIADGTTGRRTAERDQMAASVKELGRNLADARLALARTHARRDTDLAALLTGIEAADLDYPRRYGLVLDALALAHQLGYPAGIGFDPKEGLEWPVVYIEMPTGQISWHMPAFAAEWDGHSTEEKYKRCNDYAATVDRG